MDKLELPAEFAAVTGPIHSAERSAIANNYRVWLITAKRGRFVVKIADQPRTVADLAAEARLLERLALYAPFVAAPLGRFERDGEAWHLFTQIPGRDLVDCLADCRTDREIEALVAEFGRTLRAIHAWRPDLPCPDDWLGERIDDAERRVAAGLVPDPITGHHYHAGRSVAEVLAEVRAGRGAIEPDLVFGHGDWCLPNAIARDGRIVGAVDWCFAGWADRRWELCCGQSTLLYNLDGRQHFVQVFLDAYGYRRPRSSLAFFEALWVLVE